MKTTGFVVAINAVVVLAIGTTAVAKEQKRLSLDELFAFARSEAVFENNLEHHLWGEVFYKALHVVQKRNYSI